MAKTNPYLLPLLPPARGRALPLAGAAIAKYLPLDFIELENDSPSDVNLVINDTLTYRILANSNRRVSQTKIEGVKVVNLDAVNAIAASLLRMVVERSPANADSVARQQMRERVR